MLSDAQILIEHFTVEDGLPSDEVYFVHQDRKGYYWFCTDRGVSRYNGYEFTNFTPADGLTNSVVFKCFEDWDGNLWFTCIDGSITVYDAVSENFSRFKNTKFLQSKYDVQEWVHYIGFRENTKDAVFFMLDNGNVSDVYRMDSTGRLFVEPADYINQGNKVYDNLIAGALIERNSKTYWQVAHTSGKKWVPKCFSRMDLRLDNGVYSPIHVIDSSLFICTKSGVKCCLKDNVCFDFILDISVTGIIKDREELYWITSQNDGVYLFSDQQNVVYDFDDVLEQSEKLLIGKKLNEAFVLAANPAKILVLNTATGNVKSNLNMGDIAKINEFFYNEDSSSLSFYKYAVSHFDSEPHYRFTEVKDKRFGDISTFLDGVRYENKDTPTNYSCSLEEYAISTSKIYGRPFIDWTLKNSKYDDLGNVSQSVLRKYSFQKGYTYLASNLGLYKVYSDQRRTELLDFGDEFRSMGISDLDTINNITVLSTKGHGLLFVKDDSIVYRLGVANGLLSEVINNFYIDRSLKNIWCATDKGVSVIQYKEDKEALSFKWLKNTRKLDGLLSNFINDIENLGDYMMAVSNRGVTAIPKDFVLHKAESPALMLLGLMNGDSTYVENNLVFEYDQNNIEFKYEAVVVRQAQNMYRYRLVSGQDSLAWVLTDDRYVKINNMAPGTYKFQVAARRADCHWGPYSEYSFVIKERFVDLWWVRVLAASTLFLVLYIFYRRRIDQLKEKNNLQQALNNLELKNVQLESSQLRGQMNPHFIFNVLNSIQKMILKEEKENANKLLTRFSKLVRASLKYSRLEFIPLSEELEFLDNYISIEGQRYPDRFKYSIDVDATLDAQDIQVPPLLIQPLCENAIKHAFEDGNGTLYVRLVRQDDRTIRVELVDNGIGILNSTKKSSESLGISIIKDRLALFDNEGYKTKFEIMAADEKLKKGTKIVLVIPYI